MPMGGIRFMIFMKKEEMKKEEINAMADSLSERIEGINTWIKNNPNTDPNFYEIMDCKVEIGKVFSNMDRYYNVMGYPERQEHKGRMPYSYTHYEIPLFDQHAKKVDDKYNEMINLRNPEMGKVFDDIPEIFDLFQEVGMRTFIAEYDDPKGNMSKIKKEILCKSVSIPFYIWQERRTNPDFQYDNTAEFDALKEMYALYSAQVGIQITNDHADGTVYQGPQFGEQIESLISFIEKSYKYSTENENAEEKGKIH